MRSEVEEGVKWGVEKRWRCGSKERESEAVAAIEV